MKEVDNFHVLWFIGVHVQTDLLIDKNMFYLIIDY